MKRLARYCYCGILIVGSVLHLHAAIDTADASARLTAAEKAPCSLVVSLYASLALDSTMADSIRAIGYARLGDHDFTLSKFDAAMDNYEKAASLHQAQGWYDYRAGCAALAGNDNANAGLFLRTAYKTGSKQVAANASLLLGEITLASGEYEDAWDWFRKTGPFIRTGNNSVRTVVGKLACARYLEAADSVEVYEGMLKKLSAIPLERAIISAMDKWPLGNQEGDSAAKPEHSGNLQQDIGDTTRYALQVGAFASRERANDMRARFTKKFSDIACIPGIVGERTVYRVRIGSFSSRDDAESFGKNKLARQGLSYRVVMK